MTKNERIEIEPKFYSIGEISKLFDIPISTLRYYDKEGLFPNMDRSKTGIRKFNEDCIEILHVIDCLKKAGAEIKDIKEFILWCKEGPSSYQKRKDMFLKRKELIEHEIQHLNQALAMLEVKCWYYDTAIADGNEDRLKHFPNDMTPQHIKDAYAFAHEKR